MRLPDFQYVEPRSIEEACLFLKEHGQEARIMGGGTDLLPSMKQRIFQPKYLVYLGSIRNIDRMEFDEGKGLSIGSMVKLRSIETDSLILEKYPVIGKAASAVGSAQIREMGTVGGNLSLDTRCYYYNQSEFWRKCRSTCIKMGGETCNAIGGGTKCFSVFSSDLAPVMMLLGAKIKLCSAWGERILPLSDFYTGNGAKPLSMKPEEVLVSVEIPAIAKQALCTYLKYQIRNSIDFPLASVAAMIVTDGMQEICREAKVVISAIGTKPEEVKSIPELLEGRRLEKSLIEEASDLSFRMAKPIANVASSPSYRRRVIKVFVQAALSELCERGFKNQCGKEAKGIEGDRYT